MKRPKSLSDMPALRGKVNSKSALDVRDQARLYQDQMGLDATTRQGKLSRAERFNKAKARGFM
jgi:hypothetical protein